MACSTNVDIPDEFICPITLSIMVKPLCNRSGRNFERSAILGWLARGSGLCPLTREPLRPSDLIPNRQLEARILFWRLEHGIEEPEEEEPGSHDFVGFLRVDKQAPKPHLSLASMMDLEQLVRASPARARAATAATVPDIRGPNERKRHFLARLLNTACRELDDL